jgi:hypothetical protein
VINFDKYKDSKLFDDSKLIEFYKLNKKKKRLSNLKKRIKSKKKRKKWYERYNKRW